MNAKPIDNPLPPKAKRLVDDLYRKGLGDLYKVDINHRDGCQLSRGKPCNCFPDVSLVEKHPGVSGLSDTQQQQLARFAASGGRQFNVKRDGDSLRIQSDEVAAQQAVTVSRDAKLLSARRCESSKLLLL